MEGSRMIGRFKLNASSRMRTRRMRRIEGDIGNRFDQWISNRIQEVVLGYLFDLVVL
jgi:hypothetical protein